MYKRQHTHTHNRKMNFVHVLRVVQSESALISNTIFFAITILHFLTEHGSKRHVISESQKLLLVDNKAVKRTINSSVCTPSLSFRLSIVVSLFALRVQIWLILLHCVASNPHSVYCQRSNFKANGRLSFDDVFMGRKYFRCYTIYCPPLSKHANDAYVCSEDATDPITIPVRYGGRDVGDSFPLSRDLRALVLPTHRLYVPCQTASR